MNVIDVMQEFTARAFRRGDKYALVADTVTVTRLPEPIVRKRLVDWMNEPDMRANSTRLLVGSAGVITSKLVTSGLTALGWLWKSPVPTFYTSDMAKAVDWCVERLREANVPRSAALTRFHRSLKAGSSAP